MVKNVSKAVIILLSNAIIMLTLYIKLVFGYVSFEQIYFTLQTSEGTSINAILQGLTFVIFGSLFVMFLIKILNKIIIKLRENVCLKIKFKDKEKKILFFKDLEKNGLRNSFIYLLFSIFIILGSLGVFSFAINQFTSSTIYEDYYVKSKDVEIKFPEKKQNLIYIFVESFESSLMSKTNGGLQDVSYISKLENLANTYTSFSHQNTLGGLYVPHGAGWTAGAMISHTSGTPLKISIDGNLYSGLGGSLPGIKNLGDILNENGYKNYLMIGSKADFGGRSDYFKYHGNYEIFDYYYAIEKKWIPEDYFMWWGYEDSKLYEYAKEKLLEISQNEEPFNFTMLTADTHFIDGYLDESCPEPFGHKYANSYNCTDIMLTNFINWIMEQEFYNDTTIVVVGDHLTMQTNFFNVEDGYDRTVYNLIINSKVKTDNMKNRIATTFDMFPTTLASIGCSIEGNKLGFGTNLYSNEKTLTEKIGVDYLNKELNKKSFMYDIEILADTYYEMQKYTLD